jgi:hypothetical protein
MTSKALNARAHDVIVKRELTVSGLCESVQLQQTASFT